MPGELRRHPRFPFERRVAICWEVMGGRKETVCRGVDISRSGMRVATLDSLVPMTLVHFRMLDSSFSGSASVRHCRHVVGRFEVGLEFTGGAVWDPERYPLPAAKTTA